MEFESIRKNKDYYLLCIYDRHVVLYKQVSMILLYFYCLSLKQNTVYCQRIIMYSYFKKIINILSNNIIHARK